VKVDIPIVHALTPLSNADRNSFSAGVRLGFSTLSCAKGMKRVLRRSTTSGSLTAASRAMTPFPQANPIGFA